MFVFAILQAQHAPLNLPLCSAVELRQTSICDAYHKQPPGAAGDLACVFLRIIVSDRPGDETC